MTFPMIRNLFKYNDKESDERQYSAEEFAKVLGIQPTVVDKM